MIFDKFSLILILLFILFFIYKINNPIRKYTIGKKKYDDSIKNKYNEFINNPKIYSNKEILNLGNILNSGNSNISISPNSAIDLYLLALKNGDESANVYLGNIYYDGIKNELEPDITKALYFYNNAIKAGYNNCLLDVADIYMYGFREVEQDSDMAINCYKKLLKNGSTDYKLIAYDRLLQIYDETDNVENRDVNFYYQKNNKRKWDYVDNIEASNYVKGATNIKPKNFSEFINVKVKQSGTKIWDNIDLKNIDVNKDASNEYNINNNVIPGIDFHINLLENNNNNTQNIETRVIRNDRQNVHDHVVSKTVKKSAKKLRENTKLIKDIPTTLREVRNLINLSDEENKKENATKTLDTIEQKNQNFSSINMSELEALQLVWNRIHSPVNNNNINNLKNNLVNELNDCNEDREQVCSTGRFSRIIDTLNKTDNEGLVEIIPKNALNQELMNKAAQIRNSMIEKEEQNIQDAINCIEPNDKQNNLTKEFDDKFKKELLNNYKKDYVDSGVISEEILKTEVDKWIDCI